MNSRLILPREHHISISPSLFSLPLLLQPHFTAYMHWSQTTQLFIFLIFTSLFLLLSFFGFTEAFIGTRLIPAGLIPSRGVQRVVITSWWLPGLLGVAMDCFLRSVFSDQELLWIVQGLDVMMVIWVIVFGQVMLKMVIVSCMRLVIDVHSISIKFLKEPGGNISKIWFGFTHRHIRSLSQFFKFSSEIDWGQSDFRLRGFMWEIPTHMVICRSSYDLSQTLLYLGKFTKSTILAMSFVN